MAACVPTTVHTPALTILSQRYIQSPPLHLAQTHIPRLAGSPSQRIPAASIAGTSTDAALYLLTTKTLTLFYSLIDSLALETISIIFHEI